MKRAHKRLALGVGILLWLLGALWGLFTNGALGLLGGLVGSPILLSLLYLVGQLLRWIASATNLYKPVPKLEKRSMVPPGD